MSKVKMKLDYGNRRDLEKYVREKLEETVDQSAYLAARKRLEAEVARHARAYYPTNDMEVLHKYGYAKWHTHFDVEMPDRTSESVILDDDEGVLAPGTGYRCEIDAGDDEQLTAAVLELRAEREKVAAPLQKQFRQVDVLLKVAQYFDDVLEFLDVPREDRLKLSGLKPFDAQPSEAEPEDEPMDEAPDCEPEGEPFDGDDEPELIAA